MSEAVSHSGVWGLAAIMIVIASWVLQRYLTLQTWREWASAGVLQAFIIALYAEMQGSRSPSFHDDGPGIPEAMQARVFDPFFRLEGVRSRDTGGTGLGLSLSRNIARRWRRRVAAQCPRGWAGGAVCAVPMSGTHRFARLRRINSGV